MVRAGTFLDLRPMADARVLNLRVGRTSFGLEDELDGVDGYLSSSSAARLEAEGLGRRESLDGFERDHHDLEGFGEERVGAMSGKEERKERGLGVGLIKEHSWKRDQ